MAVPTYKCLCGDTYHDAECFASHWMECSELPEHLKDPMEVLDRGREILPEMPYLLRKNGMWYAHNSCGYTARAELAELYTKERAESYARMSSGEVSAVPLNEVINSVEHIQEYIDRLEAMKEALMAV